MPRHTGRSGNSFMPLSRAAAAIGAAAILGLTAAGCAGDGGTAVEAAQGAGTARKRPRQSRTPCATPTSATSTCTPTSPTTPSSTAPGPRPTTPTAMRRARPDPPRGVRDPARRAADFYGGDRPRQLSRHAAGADGPRAGHLAPRGRARGRLRLRGRDGGRPSGGAAGHPAYTLGQSEPPHDPDVVRSAWRETVAAAENHYEPGRFTTFVGYEFTGSPENQNLHRNVIFRGSAVPRAAVQTASTRSTPRRCGRGWTATARRASRPWPSPTTRTARTA